MRSNRALPSSRRRSSPAFAALIILAAHFASSTAALSETRGYVISWFSTATNNPDFALNCPQAAKDPKRAQFAVETQLRNDRALVDGKPVSAKDYPDAVVKDPNIETVVGRYAYGFDLGGPAANKFEDPETHQRIDNQLWRAVGVHGLISGHTAGGPVSRGACLGDSDRHLARLGNAG